VRSILFGAFAALAATAPAFAQSSAPERESNVIVYGEDPCPRSSDEEIVVCARRPEEERYRIPRELRERRDRHSAVSMNARAEALDEAQRDTRPGSCSVVGSGGQSGCAQQMLREWHAERRARRSQ